MLRDVKTLLSYLKRVVLAKAKEEPSSSRYDAKFVPFTNVAIVIKHESRKDISTWVLKFL